MKKTIIAFLLCVAGISPAWAQNVKGAFEISPYTGLRWADDYGNLDPDSAPIAGLRLGLFFTQALEVEVAVQRAFAEAANVAPFGGENVNMDAVRLNFLYHLMNDKRVRPYVTAGVGWERVDSDNFGAENDIGYNGGLGLRFFAGNSAGVRLEGRYVATDVENVDWQHNWEATLGLFFLLGVEKEEKVAQETIKDTDGDGVVDTQDQCPGTQTGISVDAKGCELETFQDEDGDGIADEDDQCPNTPENAPVDENGCALDTDNDGVFDYKDRCPDTEEGAEVDDNGCPVESLARGALKDVVFKSGSPELTLNSKSILNSVAEELKKFPDVKVEVQGHSDSSGDAAFNLQLSQKRAESVLEYLVSRGVNRDQLSAVGYGETQPIADNKTREGRAQNRRVELEWLD